MAQQDVDRAIRDFEARLDRRAFGAATKASYRLESDEEDVHVVAATNLLMKALRRLESDEDAAVAFVRRAVAIRPTLEQEPVPAVVAAELLLYGELADRHEAAGSDPAWLDPVLDLLASADGAIRTEFAGMLDALAVGELAEADRRRIRAAVPDGVRRQEPMRDVTDPDARAEVVLGLLRLLAALSAR